MLNKLRNLFRKNPERAQYRNEFIADMDRQLQGFIRIGSALAALAWLDFAFNTDKKLHPEFPQLLYFRLGLTAIGSLIFVTSFIPAIYRHGALSLKILVFYIVISCSWFTGRIADDPNYVSGLQIVVMIPIAAPVTRRLFFLMQGASALVFVISVLIHKPNLTTPAAAYSMNNLLISYVIAVSFCFLLDRIRFSSFIKTKKIELKNVEIEAQIKRINELKTQQDGDYFLTSELLHPLALNEAEPSRIRVDFLTEQKKKFQFRHWSSEIGGDISSSNTVMLRNKRYVAFMNGDAMGKSIQGAGGALVLGTVFKSFLHRTQNDEMSRFMFPEQWLRDCYDELHHVMISFDGRMLVSAVIGLIDEDSGFLYYINAEHPWIVVLRKNEATFIEDELTLRKLGMPENEELFRVKTFRLLKGDQIFNGAIDNASGTAALLELAKAYTKLPTPPKRTIIFLAVTGEEKGLLGAKYYATNPPYPLERTLANINKDGLNQWGRTRDISIIGFGNSTLDDLLADAASAQGRVIKPDAEPEKGFFYRSDHFEFAKQGVPALDTDSGTDYIGKPEGYGMKKRDEYTEKDYHKVTDEVKPDWDLAGAVEDVQLLFQVGYRVAQGDKWPEWKPGTEFKAKREAQLKR